MTTFPSECVGKRRAEGASDGRRISSGRRRRSDVGRRNPPVFDVPSESVGPTSVFVGRRRKSSAPSTSYIIDYRRDTDVGFRRLDVGRRNPPVFDVPSEYVGRCRFSSGDVGNYRHRRRRMSSESVGTPTSYIVGICLNADVVYYRNLSERRRRISSESI